jgi:hypothetical protein
MGKLSRRNALAIASLALGGGCASLLRDSAYYSTLAAPFRRAKDPITRAYVDSLPYASLRVQVGGGAAALLILGDVAADGGLTWYSVERQAITTRGPFVTRMTGIEVDLRDAFAEVPGEPNLDRLAGRTLERQIRFHADREVRTEVRSRFEWGEAEEIEILDRTFQTRVFREHVSSNGQRRFTNTYWIDTTLGLCRQSRQTVIPTLPPFFLQVARRYAPPA